MSQSLGTWRKIETGETPTLSVRRTTDSNLFFYSVQPEFVAMESTRTFSVHVGINYEFQAP